MYIIDRNKDFYDFYSQVYGEDRKVVFDRRGSKRINDEDLAILSYDGCRFSRRDWGFFLLEVGNTQYLFKVFDVKTKNSNGFEYFVSCSFELAKTFKENKHLFESPISISRVNIHGRYKKNGFKKFVLTPVIQPLDEIKRNSFNENTINLPILSGTSLTKLLDPFEIWKELSTYVSSLDNDKDISTDMTDVDRAGTHGFDKFSFRHPIK